MQGAVVGLPPGHGGRRQQTGEMDKIDGPYYFFKLIQRMRQLLPPWMPSDRHRRRPHQHRAGRLRRRRAWTTSATSRHCKGKCFHLVDPVGYRVGDVLDIFSKAAHAPKMNLFVNAALLGFIPRDHQEGPDGAAPVRRIRNAVMKDLGLPDDMITFVNYPTRFDCRDTLAMLKGSGIELPPTCATTPGRCGTTGSATSTRTCSSTARCGHGGRQGGAGHRRLVGHRPGGGAQVRRGRCHHHHLRPRPTSSTRPARRPRPGLQLRRLPGRHRRHGRLRPLHPAAGRETTAASTS
jgi:hypothetical protein